MKTMDRKRPYSGQSHTDYGERGKTLVTGLTMRDIVDCYIRGVLGSTGDLVPEKYKESLKGEKANLNAGDLYGFDLDELSPIAISQNMTCEIEKMMGIFPNCEPLKFEDIERVEEKDLIPKLKELNA